jgi:hypothetical protein
MRNLTISSGSGLINLNKIRKESPVIDAELKRLTPISSRFSDYSGEFNTSLKAYDCT